jgi:hypothetical protein
VESVYIAVRTESLYKQIRFVFKGLIYCVMGILIGGQASNTLENMVLGTSPFETYALTVERERMYIRNVCNHLPNFTVSSP